MKKTIGIVLTCFGSLFLFVTFILAVTFGVLGLGFHAAKTDEEKYLSPQYSSTNGIITDTSDNKTNISYSVNGQSYDAQLNLYSSSYSIGDSVLVYYDTLNPTKCQVPEMTNNVFGTLSVVFSSVGIGMFILFGGIGLALLIVGIVLIRSKN